MAIFWDISICLFIYAIFVSLSVFPFSFLAIHQNCTRACFWFLLHQCSLCVSVQFWTNSCNTFAVDHYSLEFNWIGADGFQSADSSLLNFEWSGMIPLYLTRLSSSISCRFFRRSPIAAVHSDLLFSICKQFQFQLNLIMWKNIHAHTHTHFYMCTAVYINMLHECMYISIKSIYHSYIYIY